MSNLKPLATNTFCSAKWLQVTLDLYHGLSKSCHHTQWNKISIEDSRLDYIHLFNSTKVLQDRDEMRNNTRPQTCKYCWDIEDKVPGESSDRFKKSAAPWSTSYKSRIENIKEKNYCHPSYLEVSFSHTCNLKCIYCSADSSSSIENEMKTREDISPEVSEHRKKRQSKSEHHKELVEIFFKDLKKILEHVHTLRITGGEPLLTPYLSELITHLENHHYPNLTFAINTNLSLPSITIHRFNEQLKRVSSSVKDLQIFVSIDTYGERSEKIRKGLIYEHFEKNLKSLMNNNSNSTIVLMVTLTSYSICSFLTFLKKVLQFKKRHKSFIIEITPLKEPKYLSIAYLTSKEKEMLHECFQYMKNNNNFFSAHEQKNLITCLHIAEIHEENSNEIITRNKLIKEVKNL